MKGFLSLTFHLQDQSSAVALVSVVHLHGVIPAVLLLSSDQGQNTHVAAQSNKATHCDDGETTDAHK